MNKYVYLIVILLSATSTLVFAKELVEQENITVGYVERIKIVETDTSIKAKLDTGATTSSIHADIIEKDSNTILFKLIYEKDGKAKEETFKKDIKRTVRIKKKGGKQKYTRRPVVEMTFCIAGRVVTGEVNLADRGNFNYDILVGRNMLKAGNLIVDASQSFASKPNCAKLDVEKSLAKRENKKANTTRTPHAM